MKTHWKLSIFIILLFSVLLITESSQARIRFDKARTVVLDLEKLNLGKDAFFSYITLKEDVMGNIKKQKRQNTKNRPINVREQ